MIYKSNGVKTVFKGKGGRAGNGESPSEGNCGHYWSRGKVQRTVEKGAMLFSNILDTKPCACVIERNTLNSGEKSNYWHYWSRERFNALWSPQCGVSVTIMHPHRQVVWGFTWKCTLEKNQTVETIDPGERFNALWTMHPHRQVVWVRIHLKMHCGEKSNYWHYWSGSKVQHTLLPLWSSPPKYYKLLLK